jgi:hypothetical protein
MELKFNEMEKRILIGLGIAIYLVWSFLLLRLSLNGLDEP